MPRPLPSLAEPDWTPDLARMLERASTALARLDARVSASSMAKVWHKRSAWAGLAHALQLHGEEIEEIDVFATEMGVVLPHRHVPGLRQDIRAELRSLRKAMGNTDDLGALAPPSPALEANPHAPALLRALEAAAVHARARDGLACWHEPPLALVQLRLTRRPLALFAGGDKAWRLAPRERDAIVRRYLKAIERTSDDGLAMLENLERYRAQCAATLAEQNRPGALRPLAALLIERPLIAPLTVSEALDLTISGAGKLLMRARELGMVHEISGRESWKLYIASDLAVRYGFANAPRGRPPALPAPGDPLSDVLAKFDEEMAEVDRLLEGRG